MYKVKHAALQFIVVRHIKRFLSLNHPRRRFDRPTDHRLTDHPSINTEDNRSSYFQRMITCSIIFLAATITFASSEEIPSDNVIPDKRNSMGFQGIRGKKILIPWDGEELSKRLPIGYQSIRGNENSIIAHLENELFPEETKKRAPMGFQGMRGKKNDATTDYIGDSADNYEKRAPMGFQGMRGKKTVPEDEFYKRIPMILQEIRARRILEEVLDEMNNKRAAYKEIYPLDYSNNYGRDTLSNAYQMEDKKDQFAGKLAKNVPMENRDTKDKKLILDGLEDPQEKRNIVDLQRIRESRDMFDNYFDYPLNIPGYQKRDRDYQNLVERSVGESIKRNRMGFHGMRGKRDANGIYATKSSTARTEENYQRGTNYEGNDLDSYETRKRSAIRQFTNRDKKNPRWEFRGKFVGVRGKKVPSFQTVERPAF